MATIYWDSTSRAAGAVMVASTGDTMILRTDTRWHANSPASMTGVLGGIQFNTESKILFDATKVRWMAYDTGSGNVPAIGTTVTQGGVSGYLLGVWADYTSAPTAVGAAMPATGYIKFREVTGGQFTTGTLTGIGASATEADRVGWIEAVMQQYGGSNVLPPCTFETKGDWFELGTTNGSSAQTIQLPTNGGGTGTAVHALQIETEVGSGIYEWWPVLSGANFTTTNIGTTSRCKVLRNVGAGQVMIGSTGAAAAGFTPVSGLKIRTPNIFLRLCTSAARATNLAPTSGAYSIGSSISTYIPNIILRNVQNDWSTTYSAYNLTYEDSATFLGSISVQRIYGDALINNMCIASSGPTGSFGFSSSTKQLTISNTKFGTYSGGVTFNYSKNMVLTNVKFLDFAPSGSAGTLSLQGCSNVSINTLQTMGVSVTLYGGSDNIVIDGHDVIASNRGDTTSTYAGPSAQLIIGCSNLKYKNMTIGNYGEFPNTVPYNTLFRFSACSNITITDIGTISTPVFPYSATVAPYELFGFQSSAQNVKVKRAFFGHARNYFISGGSGAYSDIVFENVGIPTNSTMTTVQPTFTENSYIKGFASGAANPTTSPQLGISQSTRCTNDVIGTTGGFLTTRLLTSYTELTQTAGSYKALSQVHFAANSTATDYAIIEQDYFIKGHNGLTNFSLTSNDYSASINTMYQIDTGTGWNGTWKTLNTTNLTAEVIDPDIGFKMKFKLNNTHASNSYYVSHIGINTTVPTRVNQPTYFYPLSTATLSFTGLIPGSEVRVYAGTDPATSVEIGGIESTSGSTFSISQSYPDEAGYIVILAMGYQPIYLSYTFKSVDDSILIQPVIDRNYTNPV